MCCDRMLRTMYLMGESDQDSRENNSKLNRLRKLQAINLLVFSSETWGTWEDFAISTQSLHVRWFLTCLVLVISNWCCRFSTLNWTAFLCTCRYFNGRMACPEGSQSSELLPNGTKTCENSGKFCCRRTRHEAQLWDHEVCTTRAQEVQRCFLCA